MNTTAKVALATAAVVVAAILGYNYLIAPNVGSPRLFAPEPTPSPTEAAIDFTDLEGGGTELEPGRYVIDYAAPIRITITIPAETYESYPSAWYKGLWDWGPWHQSNNAMLGAARVANIAADPCDALQGQREPPVDASVGALADAIEAIAWLDVTRSDVTLDGFSGQLVDLGPSEPPTGCSAEPTVLTMPGGDQMLVPAPNSRIWILDVGGERLVIWAVAGTADLTDELDTLIQSIRIEAP